MRWYVVGYCSVDCSDHIAFRPSSLPTHSLENHTTSIQFTMSTNNAQAMPSFERSPTPEEKPKPNVADIPSGLIQSLLGLKYEELGKVSHANTNHLLL